ncbi:MAG: hypothetical protein U0X93_03075 [Anaerolineales bacterium]
MHRSHRNALPVSLNMKMVSANWLIELASTETICPIQTMVKPNIPDGLLDSVCSMDIPCSMFLELF